MCLIFYYIAKYSPSPKKQYFKFILASNRDEFYFRPSKVAQYWESDSNILAGQDMELGGTWLGINKKTRRLAAVTNIMGGTEQNPIKPKLSRGSLLTNFLSSQSTLNGEMYCKNLYQDPSVPDKFNKFNLLTVDFPPANENGNDRQFTEELKPDNANIVPSAYYFTNADNSPPVCQSSPDRQDEYFGLSNSILSKPFQKVIKGCKTFEEVIQNHHHHHDFVNEGKSRESLTKNLLAFLRSDFKNFPDSQIEGQANEQTKLFAPLLSCNFVCIPPILYGTRTQTLIFVDYKNQVYFSEWTMKEPIDPERPTWQESKYTLQLN